MTGKTLVVALLVVSCAGSQPAASSTHGAPGPLGDTWTRDGGTWHQHAGAGPAARYQAALAYDAARHLYVLFGGQTATGSSDETWTWDGTVWKRMTPAHQPAARRDAAMAYDPAHQVVVLYGGLVADQFEGQEAADTWEWNGVDWTEASVGNSGPRFRTGARMVTAGDHVVLFGGHVGNLTYFGDAWSWDGTTWTRADGGARPPGRGDAAVAWNPRDSSLFVFGGLGLRPDSGPGNLGIPLADAWSMAGGTWTAIGAGGPPAISDAGAVFDTAAGRVLVMFGIVCPSPTSDQWSWDGARWTRSAVPVPARWGAAVASDGKGNVLVFGGDDEAGC